MMKKFISSFLVCCGLAMATDALLSPEIEKALQHKDMRHLKAAAWVDKLSRVEIGSMLNMPRNMENIPSTLLGIIRSSSITHLDISHNNFGPGWVKNFADAIIKNGCGRLTTVDLSGNNLELDDLKVILDALSKAESPCKIEILNLSNNLIENNAVGLINQFIAGYKPLKMIILSNNKIGNDEGAGKSPQQMIQDTANKHGVGVSFGRK